MTTLTRDRIIIEDLSNTLMTQSGLMFIGREQSVHSVIGLPQWELGMTSGSEWFKTLIESL